MKCCPFCSSKINMYICTVFIIGNTRDDKFRSTLYSQLHRMWSINTLSPVYYCCSDCTEVLAYCSVLYYHSVSSLLISYMIKFYLYRDYHLFLFLQCCELLCAHFLISHKYCVQSLPKGLLRLHPHKACLFVQNSSTGRAPP